jgi:two-component system LytT family response regulator
VRVLLADDEPPALLGLRSLLAAHAGVIVVGEAAGGRAAIEATRALAPDLLLLDVQMPEVDGFQVVERLLADPGPAGVPLTIFVTAHDAHAVRAFEVGAADYLLKPVSDARFALAMSRACAALAAGDPRALARRRLARVLAARDETGRATAPPVERAEYAARIVVRVGRNDVVVPVGEIDWVEADGYCAVVHQGGGRRFVIRQTLQALEEQLDPAAFLRVHRSAIVRIGAVGGLHHRPTSGRLDVVLRDGTRVPVSRGRQADVVRRIGVAR